VQAYAEKVLPESRKEKARITIHQIGGIWHFELDLSVSINQGASTMKLSAQAPALFGDPKIFKDADVPMVLGTKIRGWQAVIFDVVTADSAACMSNLDGTLIEAVTMRVSKKDPVAERQSRGICAIRGAMEYENGIFDNVSDGQDTLNRELNVKAKPLLFGAQPVDTKLIDMLIERRATGRHSQFLQHCSWRLDANPRTPRHWKVVPDLVVNGDLTGDVD
jgi:hypothetical protein